MLKNMFEKTLKKEKTLTIVYAQEKKVEKDDICTINGISYF